MDKLAGYYDGDNYAQHNQQSADGRSGLGKALEAMARAGLTMKYDRVHKVLGEGNFVLVASEGQFGGKLVAFHDLFRVPDGKIADHWDTIEVIPARSEWKNANGKLQAAGYRGRPPAELVDCSRKSSIARIAALLWRRCE
jgi:predicted SnoaL-like aldol condensation-catalyzing enzyme